MRVGQEVTERSDPASRWRWQNNVIGQAPRRNGAADRAYVEGGAR